MRLPASEQKLPTSGCFNLFYSYSEDSIQMICKSSLTDYFQRFVFPDAYKISEIVPIPKENPPKSLKDLRPISKTPIGGKIIEKMMVSELETDTKNTLNDPTQYGNTKGSSTTHYLIKLTDEAHKSTNITNYNSNHN